MKSLIPLMLLIWSPLAHAETEKVVFAHQNGWAYTPMYVMQAQGLVEKHATAAGIKLEAEYKNLGTNGAIRDAMLSGDVQFGVVGPPTLITMYDKTHDTKVVSNFVSLPMLLITNRPEIEKVCDFLKIPGKIALPTVKVSVQAVTLQMAMKRMCGARFDALDKQTVGLTHPDAMAALMSGGDVIGHFATPPFTQRELQDAAGKRHVVLNSFNVLGGKTSFVVMIGREKWVNANPKAYKVVVDAVEEAIQYTAQHPREAAEIYVKLEKSKETVDSVTGQMSGLDVTFDMAPNHIEKYSEFMHEVGTVKSKPTWKELSFPNLHDRRGS